MASYQEESQAARLAVEVPMAVQTWYMNNRDREWADEYLLAIWDGGSTDAEYPTVDVVEADYLGFEYECRGGADNPVCS